MNDITRIAYTSEEKVDGVVYRVEHTDTMEYDGTWRRDFRVFLNDKHLHTFFGYPTSDDIRKIVTGKA